MTIKNPSLIPPRVDFLDQRTGKISREWFLYLLNLGNLTIDSGNANDLAVQVAFDNDNTSQVSELTKIVERIDVDKVDPFSVTGTVRYVNATAPDGLLNISGVPYQNSGNITLSWSAAANRVPYFTDTDTATTSANLTFDGTTLTTTGLNVTGNTVLGDAAADTITFNAGVWTLASNVVATRAAGAAAAGVTNAVNNVFTFSADSGGTSDYRGWLDQITMSGANAAAAIVMHRNEAIHSGTNTVTTMQVLRSQINVTSSGNVTNPQLSVNQISLSGSGVVTGTSDMYLAGQPTTNGAGCIPVFNGYRVNLGATTAGHITEANAFNVAAATGPTTLVGYRGQLAAASGRWNALFDGNAAVGIVGDTRLGSTVAPTKKLDITGTLGVSGQTDLSSYFYITSNLLPTTSSNGVMGIVANTTHGAVIQGKGSSNDSLFLNSSGQSWILNPTGTRNATIPGDLVVGGDTAVNGGDLTSSATTFNLLNATVTTLNVGGAATAVNIGASTGTMTVANTTLAAKAITASTTLGVTGITTLGNKLYPATDAAATQTATGLYANTGAPNNANGANGDFYFRADGGALTTIYQRRAGAWVGIV